MVGLMVTYFKRTYASIPWLPGLLYSVPLILRQANVDPCLHQRLFYGPFSWVLRCTKFVCALQESVSPVLRKFCNQIPLTFKVKFLGGSQSLCRIPRLGNLLLALELLKQWYDCSSFCGSPTWWPCGEANGDLLQEDLCHMPHLPGLLQPEPLSPRQTTADSCLHRRLTQKYISFLIFFVISLILYSSITAFFCEWMIFYNCML